MSETNWPEFLDIVKEVFLTKGGATFLSVIAFLYLNWGYTTHALKITFSILLFKRWNKDAEGMPLGPETFEYKELYSVQNFEILAYTITTALYAVLACMFMIRLLEFLYFKDNGLKHQTQVLRRRVHRETKRLDKEGRILISLDIEQALRAEFQDKLRRMEDIVLRHEKIAMALNPDIPASPKLSEKDDSFADLFDD